LDFLDAFFFAFFFFAIGDSPESSCSLRAPVRRCVPRAPRREQLLAVLSEHGRASLENAQLLQAIGT
jgi:hypothetical protein